MTLSAGEQAAAVAALWAYRAETKHYLWGYDQPDLTHEDCCAVARARAARRREERDSLTARLQDIDGALAALDPDFAREAAT